VICDDRVKAVCETADLKGLHFLVQERPPEKPRAFPFFIKGNAHCKRGDLVAAIAAYDEAIRLGRRDTFYPLYFQTRADAYFALKDIDRAIADYDEAIKANPPDGGPRKVSDSKRAMRLSWLANAYWRRGKAFVEKGDPLRADQDFETARKLGYDRE
jgi:tetratricopeptide (TPR) repeat protein